MLFLTSTRKCRGKSFDDQYNSGQMKFFRMIIAILQDYPGKLFLGGLFGHTKENIIRMRDLIGANRVHDTFYIRATRL